MNKNTGVLAVCRSKGTLITVFQVPSVLTVQNIIEHCLVHYSCAAVPQGTPVQQ